jgi:hypothetical protein
MADLTKLGTNGNQVAAVTETKPHMRFWRVSENFAQGDAGYLDTATGLVTRTDLDTAGMHARFVGIALGPISANEAGSFIWDGSIGGFDLSALAYGASVFMSVNPGALADTDGASGGPVGRVLPLSDKDLTKVLYIKADLILGNS